MNRFIEWLCLSCGNLITAGYSNTPPTCCNKPMYFNGYRWTPWVPDLPGPQGPVGT